MSKIAIIGAGHAGVEAANILSTAGHSVTLYSNEPCLPYFRPRLIAVAFGQAEPTAVSIKPEAYYAKQAIDLRHEEVTALDAQARTVNGTAYDALLLTQGSRPFVPPFKGEGTSRLKTLWTMADALILREAIKAGTRLTVIGGGVLGLEAALRAELAGAKVTLIEAAPRLVGGQLTEEAEANLRAGLARHNIALHIGTSIASIDPDGVTLGDGTKIVDDVILCSTGARPNIALSQSAGLPTEMGLRTADDLSLAPGVFAAGDLARPTDARPVCAVRRATAMGQLAAKNLLAQLAGEPTQPWTEPTLPLFMKVGDVEIRG